MRPCIAWLLESKKPRVLLGFFSTIYNEKKVHKGSWVICVCTYLCVCVTFPCEQKT